MDPILERRILDTHYCTPDGDCYECGGRWPCDTRQLLETAWKLHRTHDISYDEGFDDGYTAGLAEYGPEAA